MNFELPHLELYLRRWRRVWLRAWLPALLLWLLLIWLREALPAVRLLIAAGSPMEELLITAGNLGVYFTLALSMSALAREPHSLSFAGRGHGTRPEELPLWYATTVSEWQALLGCLLSALWASLPLQLGLLAFIWQSVNLDPSVSDTLPLFWVNLAFSMLRLLHFSLACACLMLALRRSPLLRILPTLLALAAVFIAQWQYSVLLGGSAPGSVSNSTGSSGMLVSSGFERYSWLGEWHLVAGLVLLALLLGAMLWLANFGSAASESRERAKVPALEGSLVVILLLLPMLLGISSFLFTAGISSFDLYGSLTSVWLAPLHTALLHVYPDVYPITEDLSRLLVIRPGLTEPAYVLYGWQLRLGQATLICSLLLLLSMGLWLVTALGCLGGARSAGLRRRRGMGDGLLDEEEVGVIRPPG